MANSDSAELRVENGQAVRHTSARSRRAQYVNKACNECKRRKVKCDGARPCCRCATMSISCSYDKRQGPRSHKQVRITADNQNSQHQRAPVSPIQAMQEWRLATTDPSATGTGAAAQPQPIDPLDSAPESEMTLAAGLSHVPTESYEFCGPSSSEYTLNVVSGNLKALGMPSAILEKSSLMPEHENNVIPLSAKHGRFFKLLSVDPLWQWSRQDAISLINSWFDGIGSLYPVVSLPNIVDASNRVFACMELLKRDGLTYKLNWAAEALFNDDTDKIKVILAIGRTLEHGGRNYEAQQLFQSITEVVEGLIWNSGGIDGIQLLVLVAIYHYHLDDEVRTGRIISFAARLCLEMGLHRPEMVERLFPSQERRDVALKTFWSVYMFERRVSLGQGVPYSVKDSYVESSLAALVTSNLVPLAMLEWTKLAGKVWDDLNSPNEKMVEFQCESLDYLDYQINQWYGRLPEHFKLDRATLSDHLLPRENIFHQAVFFVRKNHLRNLIHRPVLQNASRIHTNERYAQQATEIIRETIQTLSELQLYTVLIGKHSLFFKHLLLTAFGNLLLAVVNAPTKFWDTVKEEFNMALDLIRILSARSAPVLLLWQRLQGLQQLQTKLSHSSCHQTTDNNELGHSHDSDGQKLRFEEPFPSFLSNSTQQAGVSNSELNAGSPEMREHVSSLFDALGGINAFDFY